MKKTIAIVFDGLGYGGIERVGINYIQILHELGYQIDVYNLTPSAQDLVNTLPSYSNLNTIKFPRTYCPEIYSYGIQKWWWGKYAYSIISPILNIVQALSKPFMRCRKKKYDFGIAMSGHINDLSFVGKNFIKCKKKIAWCHGNIISYLAICDAYSILYKKMDAFITLSSSAESCIYAGHDFFRKKIIKKIYNPTFITKKHLDYQKIYFLKKKYGKFILMVARAERQKGYDTAINVLRYILNEGVDVNLVFVGEGNDLPLFKKMVSDYNLDEHCFFAGSCDDVQNYYNACYINLLTSRWEGLPTVIIEGMSFGKPCVMTNSDDGEVSCNGKYCMVSSVDDIQAISKNIISLYKDKNLYKKYSDLSLERAKIFNPSAVKKEIYDTLETIKG